METALYPPVRRFLENRGFTVKGEIGGCDVVAVRHGEPPLLVICELKLTFNLELLLQAVDRAAACDEVWLAARFSRRGKGREGDARYRNLCRRLGFGMLGSPNRVMSKSWWLHRSAHREKTPVNARACSPSTIAGAATRCRADRQPTPRS